MANFSGWCLSVTPLCLAQWRFHRDGVFQSLPYASPNGDFIGMVPFSHSLMPRPMASLKGFEPPTHGLEGRCSILLSYRLKFFCGDGKVDMFPRFALNRLWRTKSVSGATRFATQAVACCPSCAVLERVMGIGPTQPAWKAGALPLSYTRK